MRTNQAVLAMPAFDDKIRAHFSSRLISRGAVVASFSPNEFRFVLLHLVKLNCVVSKEMILEQVWGDREDGGPEQIDRIINVMKYNMRPKLASIGLDLSTVWGRGTVLTDTRGA
jgi:DNA-binding response OmpR family regulator